MTRWTAREMIKKPLDKLLAYAKCNPEEAHKVRTALGYAFLECSGPLDVGAIKFLEQIQELMASNEGGEE